MNPNIFLMITIIQVFFAVIIGMYFLNLLRSQQSNKGVISKESNKKMERLQRMRRISLSEPLSEKTRPSSFSEIIGQNDGIKSLRAALCGPNPQHVIIYGPPGIGKTAAARLVLEEAKNNPLSPFSDSSRFIEIDATTARFDERGIADPLMGSVHDPIYQGAGPLGMSGIPQPKPGAVTKAHGGVLFIDEIGELHPIQINKLLKVLEDRKVFLESAYYSSEDCNIPQHIHEIFQNGLPADFRLIGATTCLPQEIPPAIRSRCVEIFFRNLRPEEIVQIAKNATARISFKITDEALNVLKKYAASGREAVNIIQIAGGVATTEDRKVLDALDIEWVVNSGQLQIRTMPHISEHPEVGFVNGLAVYGPNIGTLIEIEAVAVKTDKDQGKVNINGIVEEEEVKGKGRSFKRKGMAKSSVENVISVLRLEKKLNIEDYDIYLNFPGGVPIDGPSAGVAIAVALYSSLTGTPVKPLVALTGELSIRGLVKQIGGISAKIEAAREAGIKKVIIPKGNWQSIFTNYNDIEIIGVSQLEEVFREALLIYPAICEKCKGYDAEVPDHISGFVFHQ